MSDFLEKLGRRVRHFRMGKKLTQEGVAELCGLSAKYISDLECGKANVTVIVLDKVAASLGITAIDLMANEHEAERASLVKEITQFLETADDAKVKILYRIMKGVL
jgi:transcriptional regulator with XRE-family HTH domain